MKSNVNLSAMARVSSCMGASRLILCGTSKLWPHISRQGLDSEDDAVALNDAKSNDSQSSKLHSMDITLHRTLLPVLLKLKRDEGFSIVGVEQTSTSTSSYDFKWPHKTVLVVGHESNGISQDILDICDATVEIPLYGLPFSLNVSHALAIALSAYCQQYPQG
jgi:tRNA G18 (ribose-2'-O)-methylase SpoU